MKLVVILRNDTPLLFCGDCPSYRTVTISLTKEQENKIKPEFLGMQDGNPIYEKISRCILEEEK